jgi:cell division protein FtsQ
MENEEKKKRKKRHLGIFGKICLIILAVIIVLCLGAYIYILKNYSLTKIQVTGNIHYTSDEIIDIVTKGKKTDNTLAFYYDYKWNPVENVTFIDKFKIEVIGKHTITITVYEKSMAGCVLYMDQYVYFDNDGTVLETSPEKLLDVPCIDGLNFSSIVIGEKLPVDNKSLFQQILTMTQLIDKNELIIDEIRFNSNEEIYLYKDDIKIEMGDGTNLEDKLMNLDSILNKLQGKKGTLDLKDYTAANGNAIFKENK